MTALQAWAVITDTIPADRDTWTAAQWYDYTTRGIAQFTHESFLENWAIHHVVSDRRFVAAYSTLCAARAADDAAAARQAGKALYTLVRQILDEPYEQPTWPLCCAQQTQLGVLGYRCIMCGTVQPFPLKETPHARE